MVEFLIQNGQSLFLLILSGTFGYSFYFLAQELQRQQPPHRQYRPQHRPLRSIAPQREIRQNAPKTASRRTHPPQSKSHALHDKLIKLLNGDEKTAVRLVATYQAKFPDKPDQWHYEKAIYDLSRDRR